LNEDTTKLYFTTAELEGLPQDFIANLPTENGKHAVSLKYPELIPTLKLCKVEETRKKMRFASNTKCMKENTPM
jgi:Zn-dependent oligopeptidase